MPANVHAGETVNVAVRNTGDSCMWAPNGCAIAAGKFQQDGTVGPSDPSVGVRR